ADGRRRRALRRSRIAARVRWPTCDRTLGGGSRIGRGDGAFRPTGPAPARGPGGGGFVGGKGPPRPSRPGGTGRTMVLHPVGDTTSGEEPGCPDQGRIGSGGPDLCGPHPRRGLLGGGAAQPSTTPRPRRLQ